MIDILLWVLVLVVSLFVLIKAADYFTESAEKIGLHFGIPAFIVGVTIVAIGTSIPELFSSVLSVVKDSSEIVAGNVIGSNIANILLVLGVAAILGKRIKVTHELVHIDLALLLGSTFLMITMIWDKVFTLPEAVISIAAMIIYFLFTIDSHKRHLELEVMMTQAPKKKLEAKTIIILLVSCLFIYLGAEYTVDSVIRLSELMGIGKEVISLTAVAIGTSLPELTVTITAARKAKTEIAVGNVLGSNIFNSLGVMGISGFFGTLIVTESILFFALPVMLMATMLFFFMTRDREIVEWEGWILVLFYAVFMGKVIGLF